VPLSVVCSKCTTCVSVSDRKATPSLHVIRVMACGTESVKVMSAAEGSSTAYYLSNQWTATIVQAVDRVVGTAEVERDCA